MGTASKSFALVLVALFLASLVTLPSSTVQADSNADDWSTFHHDPAHTSYTNGSAPTTAPVVLWRFQAMSSIVSSPAIVDGRIFITDYTGDFYCLNASTGIQIWAAHATDTPAVYNGIAYAGYNLITAFNASTGDKIWSDQTLYGGGGRSPAVADGVVFTTYDGFQAYNASTGVKIWNYTTGGGDTITAPAVSNGIVYFGGFAVFALNASTGSEIWRYQPDYQSTPMNRISSPAVYGEYLYVGLPDSFYCFKASTGTQIWNNSIGAFGTSPAVANGQVYFGSPDGNVYALNASTGKKIWNYTTGYLVDSSPAVAQSAVYLGSGDGNLYAFNSSTGAKLWNFTLQPFLDEKGFDRYLFASPAVANGVIFMGSSDGVLYALGLPTAIHKTEFSNQLFIVAIAVLTVAIVSLLLLRRHRKPASLSK